MGKQAKTSLRQDLRELPLALWSGILITGLGAGAYATLFLEPGWAVAARVYLDLMIAAYAVYGFSRRRTINGIWIVVGMMVLVISEFSILIPAYSLLMDIGASLLGVVAFIMALNRNTLQVPPLLPFAIFLILGGLVYAFLLPTMGGESIIIAFFVLALSVLAWKAWVRYQSYQTLHAMLALTGVFLMIAADFMVAYDLFIENIPSRPLYGLFCFTTARFLISQIAWEHEQDEES